MRAELLPPLPSGSTPSGAGGHVDEPCGFSLHHSSRGAVAMTSVDPQELGFMPKLVIALAIVLIAAGVFWHGISAGVLERLWRQLLERPSGPMSFRFILQPSMAAIAAIHDGIKDARAGRPPYFWAIALIRRERTGRLREGLIATARIILLGLAMDLIYQLLVFKTFYPNESVIIAVLLAFVPYLLMRGPVTRIVRWWRGEASGEIR
jgi:hypothetical protein